MKIYIIDPKKFDGKKFMDRYNLNQDDFHLVNENELVVMKDSVPDDAIFDLPDAPKLSRDLAKELDELKQLLINKGII